VSKASDLSERRMFRNSFSDRGKIKFLASVTTISSYCFEARGLKFDMNDMKIYQINSMKLVGQFFDFWPRN